MKTDAELMDAFFATHSYDKSGDWRAEPLTAEDPDEKLDDTLPAVKLGDKE